MTPGQIGEAVGLGIGAGAAVIAAARRWFNPSERKIDKVIEGLGAGNGGPTIVSLVMSTAEHVQRLGDRLDELHGEFREHNQQEVANRDQDHLEHLALQTRLGVVEDATKILDKTHGTAAALSAKTEEIAWKLRQENLRHLKLILDGQNKLLGIKKGRR